MSPPTRSPAPPDPNDDGPIPDDPLGGIDTPGPHVPNTVAPDSADSEVVPDITFPPEVIVTEIIPIAPGDKYVILIPANTETDLLFELQDVLGDWWADGSAPFLIIGDQFKLVKVDKHSKIPVLASCSYEKCPGHEPGSAEECETVSLK